MGYERQWLMSLLLLACGSALLITDFTVGRGIARASRLTHTLAEAEANLGREPAVSPLIRQAFSSADTYYAAEDEIIEIIQAGTRQRDVLAIGQLRAVLGDDVPGMQFILDNGMVRERDHDALLQAVMTERDAKRRADGLAVLASLHP